MTDRTVRVVLRATVDQYRTAMASAAAETDRFGSKVGATTAQTHKSMQTLGRGMVVGGAAVLAGYGVMIGASARFEKQMSGVKAVANATSGEMKKLSEAALKAGADTAFSASDAARAEAELAKAGVEVKDILGGALRGALSLAAAGQLDLADAATVSAQAMNVFKLKGKDVGHIADVLASAANKSAADVKQLGDGLRQGGLVAAQTGLSLEETTGALAAFADNALVGSDAGTSLKTMLQRLTPQSAEAASKMDELGITAYDAQGQFIGLERFAGVLQDGLRDLTDEQKSSALATIFGSDAVRAAAILYDQGSAGIREYVKDVNDQGAAARMAATQMDNLSGDVEQLSGSLETVLIKNGSGGNKVLRELTQSATGAVNAFGSLPGPVQQGATGLLVLGGAAAAAGGAVMMGVGQLSKFKTNLENVGVSAERTGRMVKGAGVAMRGIGAAGAAVALLGVLEQINTAGAKSSGLPRITEGLVDLARQERLTGQALKVFGDDFENLGHKIDVAGRGYWTSFTTGQKSIKNARQDLDDLDKALAGLQAQGQGDVAETIFGKIKAAAAAQGVSVDDLNETFNDYGDALANTSTQTKLTSGATGGLTDKIEEEAKAAKAAADALRDQADALKAQFDPIFGVEDALSKQAEAQKAVNDTLRKHGSHSKEYLQAQQDALHATVDLDGAVLELEAGLKDGSVSLQTVNSRLDAYARAGLISTSQARTFKAELAAVAGQTSVLSSKLGTLNTQHPKPTVNGASISDAQARADRLLRRLGELDDTYVTPRVGLLISTITRDLPKPTGSAAGGPVVGPGSGTSDSIPMMLSNGEYVVNAEATSHNRALLDLINSGQMLPGSSSSTSPVVTNNYNYQANVTALPGEPAGQSVPRALREAAFLARTG